MNSPYFTRYDHRCPPRMPALSPRRAAAWHLLAGLTIGAGARYIYWRWTHSLNPDALMFSIMVAAAETLSFLATLLFFHDIWREGDSVESPSPARRADAGLSGDGPIRVDLFITSYDEGREILVPSILAAQALECPANTVLSIHLLDDGQRAEMAQLAADMGIAYLSRNENKGFKAGNLRNALFQTDGDFIVICDADTRVLPGFLHHTLGYFRDSKVAWVQTPHWFYDIPEGQSWHDWLGRRIGRGARLLAPVLRALSGTDRVGRDPFLSDPTLFFDVILRRRNRNGASFCCGAGSIHRREALFHAALRQQAAELSQGLRRVRPGLFVRAKRFFGKPAPAAEQARALLPAVPLQPFRFHVSEDIYTSILIQSDPAAGWRSVYHPQVECRMLSPWSVNAWAIQRLKYAGGTFDIMLRANPLFRRGMNWRTKLHYAATFWSYLSALWMPVLLLAPVVALFTGIAPVRAYSIAFFAHLLPVLILNEAALAVGCKGYNLHAGRVMAVTVLPVQLRALWSVLRGRRPAFPTTPKLPGASVALDRVGPNLALLLIMAGAAVYGLWANLAGVAGHDRSLLTANLFWLCWNAAAVGRIVLAALWTPEAELAAGNEMGGAIAAGKATNAEFGSQSHAA